MHTHYKGTGKVHSYKGLLLSVASGVPGQRKISIQGSVGSIAWRITKFQAIGERPGDTTYESIVKLYREEQTSVDGLINFDDNQLLGVALWTSHSTAPNYADDMTVIFDNALFSRNIYVTHIEMNGAAAVNYYIELEEVTLSTTGKAQLALAAARRTGER